MVAASGVQAGVDIETFDPIDQRSYTLAVSGTHAERALTFPNLRTKAQPTVRLVNAGAADIYVRLGGGAAAVPSGATPGDFFMPVGSIEVFPVRPADDGTVTVSAITATGTATLHIAMGYGA